MNTYQHGGAPRFEWDERKARGNFAKHGISFEEAVDVFDDPLARFYDAEEIDGELRSAVIGFSSRFNLLLVVHTERRARIRIISARLATAHERRRYQGR